MQVPIQGPFFPSVTSDVLLNAYRDIGLSVNTGETKHMEIGRHQALAYQGM